jgi:hypothetical protein
MTAKKGSAGGPAAWGLLAALVATLLLSCIGSTLAVGAPEPLLQAANSVDVNSSPTLFAALRNSSVELITLLDNITMAMEDWVSGGGPAVISPGRFVSLRSVDPNRPVVLDFGQILWAVEVQSNSTLKFERLVLQGEASRFTIHNFTNETSRFYAAQGFGLWPSVTPDIDAEVLLNQTYIYLLSDNCSYFVSAVAQYTSSVFGARVSTSGSTSISIAGTYQVDIPLLPLVGMPVILGNMSSTFTDLAFTCIDDPQSPVVQAKLAAGRAALSSAPAWWVWLVLALGVALLLVALAGGAYALLRRRRKKEQLQFEAAALAQPKNSDGRPSMESGAFGNYSNYSSGVRGSGMLPELWKAKMLGQMDEIEVGPLIGRGGYGRVYKGRWKSALVALKVVEHKHKSIDSAKATFESILSTYISHPNVVRTQ